MIQPLSIVRVTFVGIIMLLSACDSGTLARKVDLSIKASEADLGQSRQADVYRFGFDLRSSAQEDSRQYQGLLNYLSNRTGLKFVLAFVRSDQSVTRQFSSGAIDFAAGAATTIQAMRAGVAAPIALGVSKEGRTTCRAAIVVPLSSELTDIRNLQGKRFAFGDESSTQGHVIPRLMLKNAGLSLSDLGSYVYTTGNLACAEAVIKQEAEGCGMHDVMAAQMAADKKLRILMYSDEYPSGGIIASTALPAVIREKVAKALLEFQPDGRDGSGLYHWERTEMPKGFVAASNSDYHALEMGMAALGL